jgi:hypothetical protein
VCVCVYACVCVCVCVCVCITTHMVAGDLSEGTVADVNPVCLGVHVYMCKTINYYQSLLALFVCTLLAQSLVLPCLIPTTPETSHVGGGTLFHGKRKLGLVRTETCLPSLSLSSPIPSSQSSPAQQHSHVKSLETYGGKKNLFHAF